jgi:negative regulator of flagellin synthesis FlgM
VTDKTGKGEYGKRTLDAKRSAAERITSAPSSSPASSAASDPLTPSANRQTDTSNDDMNNNDSTMTAELLSLTARLRTLSALDETIDGLPVIDVTKVARIRFAIETGMYRISPQRIADKIVDFEREWH